MFLCMNNSTIDSYSCHYAFISLNNQHMNRRGRDMNKRGRDMNNRGRDMNITWRDMNRRGRDMTNNDYVAWKH